MGEFPPSKLVPLVTIHPWSLESIGLAIISIGGTLLVSTGSVAYPTAELAILIPFVLAQPFMVVKLFVWKGATISGNLDVGIYTSEGGASPVLVKIVSSGSTAMAAGANAIQELDITDTQLVPGTYYMALAHSDTTGTFFTGTTANASTSAACGIRFKTSAFPLPATITAPDDAQTNRILVFGLTGRVVI